MALKATIYKALLQVADMDRNYFQDHPLTIARHPSETDERMMVRLLAFALHADAAMAFANGLSADDEPDLWRRDLTGAIQTWIDVGQPDEKLLRKACGRARQVFVYCYGGRADLWWEQASGKLARTNNLTVMKVPPAASLAMAKLARRNMQLQCTIQDGQIWIASDAATVQCELMAMRLPA